MPKEELDVKVLVAAMLIVMGFTLVASYAYRKPPLTFETELETVTPVN